MWEMDVDGEYLGFGNVCQVSCLLGLKACNVC